ncbi:MAG: sialidase family protein [Ktedonobacteraceae bacterium]
MKNRKLRILLPVFGILVLLLAAMLHFQTGVTSSVSAKGSTYSNLSKLQKRLLSAFAANELNPQDASAPNARPHNYFPHPGDDQCSQQRGSNIKVNQNCLNLTDADLQGRAQSNNETSIAQDPNHPNHIVASDNDYRRGDGNCYSSYSLDGGQTWNDSTIPMSFTRGTAFNALRQYWQAGGDTSVAWDTKGNAYLDCQVFQRGPLVTNNPDQSSAVYVFRSTLNNGASWNFPGRPVIEASNTVGLPFEDKPLMTVDNHVGSPYQDRVYVVYTEFAANGTADIYESYSADYGNTFSPRVLVSTTSSLCPNVVPGDAANSCDANQFAQPFTGPDGNLYVAYANYNNAVTLPDNRNQILLSKSTDGGQSFHAPVKAADYYDLPDCATYQGGQDAGRACVPEKGSAMNSVFRATNYPSGAVNPMKPSQVVVTVGSYINKHSNERNGCVPAGFSTTYGNNLYTGVKTPGACNNDILVSISNDRGATFTGTTTDPRHLASVTQNERQETTDQWWQWAAFTNHGRLAVSYYDRQYGRDEFNGNMDISLSGVDDPYSEFNAVRVTSSSMPVPTEFPDVQGNSVFFGDYTGLSAVTSVAHPLWMDTRSPDLFLCPNTGVTGVPPAVCEGIEPSGIVANDQDIYTASVTVPGR